MYVIHPEEHQFTEPEVIAQQILPATLGTDKNLQRINRVDNFACVTADTGVGQLNSAILADGSQKLKNQLAVQGVQNIVVLKLKIVWHGFKLVQ